MNSNILVLDIGAGNIHAITNILNKSNLRFEVSASSLDFERASHVILPGVGGYNEFMANIEDSGLAGNLRKFHESSPDKFLLGICIGMQILGNRSEEGAGEGLGLIPGVVKKIGYEKGLKIPHMGWNSINIEGLEDSILQRIDLDLGFYFLHSYYFEPTNEENCIAKFNYKESYPALIKHKNVYGIQGHPEKSHDNGIQLIKNFCELNNG